MGSPPNILFIMSDDHAAHAISAYTKKSTLHPHLMNTPNIDRIAAEGMLFDNCFCTNSICAPSRASIMTGTYNHINGVTTLATHIDNSQVMFPQILQKAGYQTAIVGKWHLGHGQTHNPTGFDYWEILPGHGTYNNPAMIKNGKPTHHHGYITDIITDLGINWLEKRDPNRPFCLMLHHKAPHRTWNPDKRTIPLFLHEDLPYPKTFDDDYSDRSAAPAHARMRVDRDMNGADLKATRHRWHKQHFNVLESMSSESVKDFSTFKLYTREKDQLQFKGPEDFKKWKYQAYMKDYLRVITTLDENIGRTLKYLDDNHLTENTIVIYTSDQGFFLGDHGWYDKRFMYEESLRMPFIIRYPQEIKANTCCKDMILNVDFAQTLLDFAQCEIPTHMQGKSIRPLLLNKTPTDWRKSMYYRYWMNGADHRVYAHYGLRTLKHKLIYYYCDPCKQPGAIVDAHQPEWELFDLDTDPYELHNVYSNAANQELVKKLKLELAQQQALVKDSPFET